MRGLRWSGQLVSWSVSWRAGTSPAPLAGSTLSPKRGREGVAWGALDLSVGSGPYRRVFDPMFPDVCSGRSARTPGSDISSPLGVREGIGCAGPAG